MKVLILSILLGCALSAKLGNQGRQLSFDLQSSFNSARSYLPPNEDNEPEGSCPPSVVYRTQTKYSTYVVPSTVYVREDFTVYRTATQKQVVPTTFVKQVVSTAIVPQVKYVTRVVTVTKENVRTNFVTLPAQYNTMYLTETAISTALRYETKFITRVEQVPTTLFKQVTSTQVVVRQVASTVFRTNTITRSYQLPAVTKVVDEVQFNTKYSTVVIPAEIVLRTKTVVNTNYVERTVTLPGAIRVITSTAVLPVYTTLYSTLVEVSIRSQVVTSTQQREIISTVREVKYSTQYNTQYVTVPQQVVQTRIITEFVPTTVFRTQTVQSVVNIPAETQYNTVYRTVVRTQQIPGITSTRINTRFITNTNLVTSTVINRQINTVTATETIQEKCTGYNYDAPKTPFIF